MKPLWTQTLAWVAAALVALLLAYALPEGVDFPPELPHGANAPR
jgi:hypothetical protein